MINPDGLARIGYGERYSDDSGWAWLIEYDGSDIIIRDAGSDVRLSVHTVNPRRMALALDRIADALGFDKLGPEKGA